MLNCSWEEQPRGFKMNNKEQELDILNNTFFFFKKKKGGNNVTNARRVAGSLHLKMILTSTIGWKNSN